MLPLDLTSFTEERLELHPDLEPVILDLTTASLGDCDYTTSLSLNGNVPQSNMNQIVIARDDFELRGTYTYVYQMAQTNYNHPGLTPYVKTFTVEVELYVNCGLVFPSILQESARFEFDTTDELQTMVELDLSDATDLDCTFQTALAGHEGLPYIHVIDSDHSGVISSIRIDLSSSLLSTNTTLELTYSMVSQWTTAEIPQQSLTFEVLLYQP